MQRMQMMQQQQGQQPGQQPAAMQAPPEIHLMANTRRNTVIVNAPPDKMGIIKSAIWKIDVPSDRPSLSDNTQLMQPYRLATVDPEVVVSFLQTVADLDPQTKLDIDKKTHTVIAYASAQGSKGHRAPSSRTSTVPTATSRSFSSASSMPTWLPARSAC